MRKLKQILKSASNKNRKVKQLRKLKQRCIEIGKKSKQISIMQLEVSRKWYHNIVLYVIPILFYTPPLTNLQRVAQDPLG